LLAWLTAFAGQYIALINPYFNANHTKGRMCFRQTIIDIGTQRMQGNFSLYLFFSTSNFRSTQSSADHDPYTPGI
jgi:hypothetical protein